MFKVKEVHMHDHPEDVETLHRAGFCASSGVTFRGEKHFTSLRELVAYIAANEELYQRVVQYHPGEIQVLGYTGPQGSFTTLKVYSSDSSDERKLFDCLSFFLHQE